MNKRILFVDDERHFSAMTKEYLETQNYEVELLHDPLDVADVVESRNFDICILDIQMPHKNGIQVAREIKRSKPSLPFIFLSGKSATNDKINGLQLGAQDYITKPYSLQELTLRIQNIIERVGAIGEKTSNAVYTLSDKIEYNHQTQTLTIEGRSSTLTNIENTLLHTLVEQRDRAVARDILLNTVWSDNLNAKSRSLNVYITKLRKRFKDQIEVEILSIHGYGYKLIVK